jgi:hypothetical protein
MTFKDSDNQSLLVGCAVLGRRQSELWYVLEQTGPASKSARQDHKARSPDRSASGLQ